MTRKSPFQRLASRGSLFASSLRARLFAPAPVRPTVLIQSDDWGNAGMPSTSMLEQLNQLGMPVPVTPWDLYGLEHEQDLAALGELLLSQRDGDGHNAVMSAVFVVANADVVRMHAEGYREFHAVPIWQGFPEPWQQGVLLASYQQLVASGALFPALHGYTHLNPQLLLTLAREDSARGERIRAMHALGIPYLTSQTPEYIFALLDRSGAADRFLSHAQQQWWLEQGIRHFELAFGQRPASTCAPGYRFNDDTCRLWAGHGIAIVHSAQPFHDGESRVWNQARNVFFEPVLRDDALLAALQAAEQAVGRGEPIVICSHSINYVSRHVGAAADGRAALLQLLQELKRRHPDLRYADEARLYQAWQTRDAGWWRTPTAGERLARLAA
ncbi:MAG TPA: hypothetical protein VMH83_00195 [Candidatus Acidoferrum sp.]|nr:hypothetical protein [Candidatus Acidoferrum sp.]